jgi:sialate O-acetylesterase
MKWINKSLICIYLISVSLQAQTKLPSVFGDNMVLQQKEKVSIWGKDIPNSQIKITTSWGAKALTKADKNGFWKTKINTHKGSFNSEIIKIEGTTTITLKNILIGEVWLCSGQSNMEMPMDGLGKSKVLNADKYLKKSINKNIRLFNNPRAVSAFPNFETGGNWLESNKVTANKFSAIGYIFGLSLFEKLNVPIGIIETSWGGTRIEFWLPKAYLEKYEDVKNTNKLPIIQNKQNKPKSSFLYNAMIYPFQDFKIKGILWYQGESNRNNPKPYANYMKDLIDSWRIQWNDKNLPFYFVQIAPYNYVKYRRGISNYTNFIREAQLKISKEIENTGLVVTTDLGDCKDVHPSKKGEVAKRLANWALANEYNMNQVQYKSAEFESIKINENQITVNFKFYKNDYFVNTENIKGFAISGADKIFYPAKVILNKDKKSLTIFNKNITNPRAVRYGFLDCFESNLKTKSGLPISVFRTDSW